MTDGEVPLVGHRDAMRVVIALSSAGITTLGEAQSLTWRLVYQAWKIYSDEPRTKASW